MSLMSQKSHFDRHAYWVIQAAADRQDMKWPTLHPKTARERFAVMHGLYAAPNNVTPLYEEAFAARMREVVAEEGHVKRLPSPIAAGNKPEDGEKTRQHVLEIIRAGKGLSTKQISERLGYCTSAIGTHLRELKNAGLVYPETNVGRYSKWHYLENGKRIQTATHSPARNVILAAMRKCGLPMTSRDIMEATGCSASSIRKALLRMLNAKIAKREKPAGGGLYAWSLIDE